MRKAGQLVKVVEIMQKEKVITHKEFIEKYGKEFSTNSTAIYWLRNAVKLGLLKKLRITRHYVLFCVEYEFCIERLLEIIKKAIPCVLDLHATAKSKCITMRPADLSPCLGNMPITNGLADWVLSQIGELVKRNKNGKKWYRICRKI
ncbi:MAG: hypothetical protein QW212_06700 [Nitrososphaerales archaeon]